MTRKIMTGGLIVLGLLVLPAVRAPAQSVANAIEQLILDVQKLSMMRQMLTGMRSEFALLQKGYDDIKGLSQDVFSLHKNFLDGLLSVSPSIQRYSSLKDIIGKEAMLVAKCSEGMSYSRNSGLFTGAELDGFSSSYGMFLQRAERLIEALSMVTTDGVLRMDDGDRMSAIDRIDADLDQQVALLAGFNRSVAMQVAQRLHRKAELGMLRSLYGVDP